MEMESVFLDNLPDTANMILNILWDRNEEMCTAELTEAVNEVYNRRWEKRSDTGIYQSADPYGLCGEEKAWISCILHCIRFRL